MVGPCTHIYLNRMYYWYIRYFNNLQLVCCHCCCCYSKLNEVLVELGVLQFFVRVNFATRKKKYIHTLIQNTSRRARHVSNATNEQVTLKYVNPRNAHSLFSGLLLSFFPVIRFGYNCSKSKGGGM